MSDLSGTDFPAYLTTNATYVTLNGQWMDLLTGGANIGPPRNGVDRSTGKLLQSWPHVQQSMNTIFMTPYHSRVLRRWVGSFVPHILGRNFTQRTVMRFYWAIISAIDPWEPDYRIKRVYFMGAAVGVNPGELDPSSLIRLGHAIFRQEGVWMPRGHLGDFTPYTQKQYGIVGKSGEFFDIVPVGKNT